MANLNRRRALGLGLGAGLLAAWPRVARADSLPGSWGEALAHARGQTVYFNAWGGNERINQFIAWAGQQLLGRHGLTLRHVKLTDTADAVSRVIAEKAAGREDNGTVDTIWINGENFAAMKTQGLLAGPFTQLLPNQRLVDTESKLTTGIDFTVPVEGMEAPWGMAQLVFIYDAARLVRPPRRIEDFLGWAAEHRGRFTYPAPPDFVGTTFLKQALYALIPGTAALLRPVEAPVFASLAAKLWTWLDELHPYLWRSGQAFPATDQQQRQLLDDGEVDLSLSFNPGEASSAIAQGLLPDTARTYVLEGGSIGNTHFLAIPFNAAAKAGAMVTIDFLLSPEAQARKADPELWGDPTVLALDKLSPTERALFERLPLGIATLAPDKLGPTLPEPHPNWTQAIEAEWRRRYAS